MWSPCIKYLQTFWNEAPCHVLMTLQIGLSFGLSLVFPRKNAVNFHGLSCFESLFQFRILMWLNIFLLTLSSLNTHPAKYALSKPKAETTNQKTKPTSQKEAEGHKFLINSGFSNEDFLLLFTAKRLDCWPPANTMQRQIWLGHLNVIDRRFTQSLNQQDDVSACPEPTDSNVFGSVS